MDDDFLYKLIDDSRRQFSDAHTLPCNGCKVIKVGLILHVQSELVANVFARLLEQEQKILILRYVPGLGRRRDR